jgi:hypothetical protein
MREVVEVGPSALARVGAEPLAQLDLAEHLGRRRSYEELVAELRGRKVEPFGYTKNESKVLADGKVSDRYLVHFDLREIRNV